VLQEPIAENAHTVSFVLPDDTDIASVPVPTDAQASTRGVPAHDVAARRFGGGWSEAKFEENGTAPLEAVERAGLHPVGEPVLRQVRPALEARIPQAQRGARRDRGLAVSLTVTGRRGAGCPRDAKLARLPSNGRGQRELAHPVTGTAQRVRGAIYAISTRCQEDDYRRVRHPSR